MFPNGGVSYWVEDSGFGVSVSSAVVWYGLPLGLCPFLLWERIVAVVFQSSFLCFLQKGEISFLSRLRSELGGLKGCIISPDLTLPTISFIVDLFCCLLSSFCFLFCAKTDADRLRDAIASGGGRHSNILFFTYWVCPFVGLVSCL